MLTSSDAYYVHTDQLGTPRIVSDGNTAIWRWESGPFGEEAAQQDPDGDEAEFTYNLRFPGQYYDVETALHYNYFRTYDPSTGRYLESDPIGLDGGLNTYGYVGGNPLSYVDPLGLQSIGSLECYMHPWCIELMYPNISKATIDRIVKAAAQGATRAALEKICEDDDKVRCRKAKDECIEECLPSLGKPGTIYTDCIAKCMDRKGCDQFNPKWKT